MFFFCFCFAEIFSRKQNHLLIDRASLYTMYNLQYTAIVIPVLFPFLSRISVCGPYLQLKTMFHGPQSSSFRKRVSFRMLYLFLFIIVTFLRKLFQIEENILLHRSLA